jgi:hypothetical protein
MKKLYKPCGKEMQVNEKCLDYALSLGWTEKKPTKKRAPAKKKETTEKAE